ncbi:N-acetylglucosamine-6-phosphate deacetylase [Anaerolineales bacterium HSG6]|nr:N-acetylglucosamine-6-phosphate deacetylase [Anaerolineales bacterium HSG6]MDM8531118.1 N-acetylglucosamine-6-phosphate deacetylase [Anaerolineales bacterium HSG25]
MSLYIKNGTIITPQQQLTDHVVLVENNRITDIGTAEQVPCPAEAQVVDADGLLITPGFIDLQLNGAFGLDFTADPTTLWEVAAKLPRYGVTSFLPTVITAPPEKRALAQTVITEQRPADYQGTTPLGLHFEGPFFNPAKKGAHNKNYICLPNFELTDNWSPETGVRLVTMAPEMENALPVIRALVERGVVVSAGHSMANYDEAKTSFNAGVRYGTHLFNAMPPLHHRDPGLPGALLSDSRPVVGLIADGIHVHPGLVDMVWQTLGAERLNLVTDAMAALGMPPGQFELGDYKVTVTETSARLANGTLAGSILAMDEALRNLIAYTACSLKEALPTITSTPARLLGLSDTIGQVAVGYHADLALLTPDYQVAMTIAQGNIVYQT